MPTPRFDPAFDGHSHTEFCPHGNREPLERYLDRAVELGLQRYAVTEHIPLPSGFVDPFGPYQCAGPADDLPRYLTRVGHLREAYGDVLRVYRGLEIDWLGDAQGGWHESLLSRLDSVWDQLDPEATLLSVHFLGDSAVDGTPALARRLGATPEAIHLAYYAALQRAIRASWTMGGRDLRPRRVSHLTLPRKFIRALPLTEPEPVLEAALATLELIAAEGLELDVNTAGLDKPDCGETYLPEPLLGRAVELGIQLVFGSDAHAPREVGRHLESVLAALEPYQGRAAAG